MVCVISCARTPLANSSMSSPGIDRGSFLQTLGRAMTKKVPPSLASEVKATASAPSFAPLGIENRLR